MYDHGPDPAGRVGREPYPEPVAAHFCDTVGAQVYCDRLDCPYCGGAGDRVYYEHLVLSRKFN